MNLHEMKDTLESTLSAKGFDSYRVHEIAYQFEGYCSGWSVSIHVDDGGETDRLYFTEPEFSDVLAKVSGIKGRKVRDLERMARAISQLKGMQESLKSVELQTIAADILDRAEPVFNLLTYEKESV